MDPIENRALTTSIEGIVSLLELESRLLDVFLAKDIITPPEHVTYCKSTERKGDKNRDFYHLLLGRGRKAYSHFVNALMSSSLSANQELGEILEMKCQAWTFVSNPENAKEGDHTKSQLAFGKGPSSPPRPGNSYSARSLVDGPGGKLHLSGEVHDKREAPPDNVPPRTPTKTTVQRNTSNTSDNPHPSNAERARPVPKPRRRSGDIPSSKLHQRHSSPIESVKATDVSEEDRPAHNPMTRPDSLDRSQMMYGKLHQPEQSQPNQVPANTEPNNFNISGQSYGFSDGLPLSGPQTVEELAATDGLPASQAELADLGKTPNSSSQSSEEHHGPEARATHVKKRLRRSSSTPTTPCVAGIDINLPVFGAELGDHPPTPSSQIIQHQLDPEMTDYAKDKLMRRDTHNAQLSSDGRAPNTRSVPRNGGSGDSSDAATAMTSDTVDALASLSVSSRSQGGARHTAPAAPSFCPPPSKPAALWTVSLPVYHSSDNSSHKERAEGCHAKPVQEQAHRRNVFAFKLKQHWPTRKDDRCRYLADLYECGVETKASERLTTYYIKQFGEDFFCFEVAELSMVQKALSSGVKIQEEHVDILRGLYRVEVQGCPLRMTRDDVRKLLSQYGLVIAVPDRDIIDDSACHSEYYADMLLSRKYADQSTWVAKTRCESYVRLEKLPF